jgi:hypothetical protein
MLTPKMPFAALPPDRRPARGVFARAVGSFVPKLAAKAFEKFGFHSAEIMTAWPRVVGAEISEFTAPERIKWPRGSADADGTGGSEGATLVLRVEPARALDVEYRSAEIIDRINRYFGYRAIAALRLIQAPLLASSSKASASALRTPSQSSKSAPAARSADGVEDGLASALEALRANVEASSKQR